MNETKSLRQILLSRRTLVTLGIVVILSVILFVFLNKRNNIPDGSKYTMSDIVHTNSRQVQNTVDDHTVFFTGSNIAKIKSPLSTKNSETTSLLDETAYTEPGKVIYDTESNGALISVLYTGQDNFFTLGKQKAGAYWIYVAKYKEPRLINPNLNQTIDATIKNGTVYGLTVEKDKKFNLYSYNVSNRRSKILVKNTLSNSVLGANNSTIITRETNGTVVAYSVEGKVIRKNKLVGTVIYDKSSNKFININDDIIRKSYKLTVFDASSGKKLSSKKMPYRYIYVNSGYIFAIEKKSRPNDIIQYSQNTLKPVRHKLDLSSTRSEDAIISIVLLQNNPRVYGVVGSSNSLYYLSSDSEFIKSIPEFKYPVIKSGTVGSTEIKAFPGLSSVILTTNDTTLANSTNDLRKACGCDVNQLEKTWLRPFIDDEEIEKFE